MKFNETLEKEQNWKEFKLTDKWTTVFIESPDTISHEDTVSMIMRNESMFYWGSGNDWDFRNFCRDYVHFPKEIPVWLFICIENKQCSNNIKVLLKAPYFFI